MCARAGHSLQLLAFGHGWGFPGSLHCYNPNTKVAILTNPFRRASPPDLSRRPTSRPIDQPDLLRVAEEDRRLPWLGLEQLVHLDPAGRGLASFRRSAEPLDAGQLRTVAVHIAQHARAVGIVTGFCATSSGRVTAETDGPPGALFLARALLTIGVDVYLISDAYGLPLLQVGCELWNLDRRMLVEIPFEDGTANCPARMSNDPDLNTKTDRWVREFFASERGQQLSHLIAIERPGPSHTLDSLALQTRSSASPTDDFANQVSAEHQNVCHNMRGGSINDLTAKSHRLFEYIREQRLPITTIGIGDGGNEIGMGKFPWEQLVEAIGSAAAGRNACRLATDFTLIAGVSNWGAYALALAIGKLRGTEASCDWQPSHQRALIEAMVQRAGAIDGLTLRPESTVDGLPLDVYLQPLVEMRKLLGISDSPRSDSTYPG